MGISEVTSLEFDGPKKKAFAVLRSMLDDDIVARVPAVLVMLHDEDYLKTEQCHVLHATDAHPVNQAFALFSAVKRAVGLTARDRRNRKGRIANLATATDYLKRLLGFVQEGLKEKVFFFTTHALLLHYRSIESV